MINYQKKRKKYKANHSSFQSYSPHGRKSNYQPKKAENNEVLMYFNRLITHTLICLCIFIGVLMVQRMPDSSSYMGVRSAILSEIPFSKYSDMYEALLVNLFPLSHRVPAKQPDVTVPAGSLIDEGNYQSEEVPIALQIAKDVYRNIVINPHEKGVLVGTFEGQEVSSFVSGIVIDKGTSANSEIGNFITIQRSDEWMVTIGLLEEIVVSRLEHINIGDTLGVGSVHPEIEGKKVYYVAIENKDGEYIDITNYLNQLINEAGE